MTKSKTRRWHFHDYLDKYLHQRLSLSVFFRIWLAIGFLIVLIGTTSFYALQKTIRPSAKRVVEDTLADTSRLLAQVLADDVADFLQDPSTPLTINFYKNQPEFVWYDKKTASQFHLYITDWQGVVLYDSWGVSVGEDFSQWNDVYLTLQGKYGARSTQVDGASVMYVASPIIYHHQTIGVVSVGKPTTTLAPYLQASEKELIKILVQSTLFSLIVALFIAMWFRHSIDSINRYTQSLASSKPPHFYLAYELNALTANIKQMKDTIENKAYISEYVHTLTHELKSPLSAIRASGELLADEMTTHDRTFFSGLIVSQSERMATLIDRLLVLAKLEQPNFQLNLQRILPFLMAKDCLMHHAQAHQKGMIYQVLPEGDDQSAFFCQADGFWLGQALQNVIDNAVFYGLSWVVVIADGKKLYVVNDSVLVPDYVLERAFERYFSFCPQSTTKAQDNHKGTGLGLPLVRQILHHHHASSHLTQQTLAQFYQQLSVVIQAQFCNFCYHQHIDDDTNIIVMTLDFEGA